MDTIVATMDIINAAKFLPRQIPFVRAMTENMKTAKYKLITTIIIGIEHVIRIVEIMKSISVSLLLSNKERSPINIKGISISSIPIQDAIRFSFDKFSYVEFAFI